MSSSCPEGRLLAGASAGAVLRRTAIAGFVSAAALLAGSRDAGAEQWYLVPSAETSAEWNSNREMTEREELEDPGAGYRLVAGLAAGVRTPRGALELRPRVQLQEFPDRSGVDPVDGTLDADGFRRFAKGEASLRARYARQDVYNAEYGSAGFDERDPADPGIDASGIVLVGGRRDTLEFEPTLRWQLNPLTAIEAGVEYEQVDYQQSIGFRREGYDSLRGDVGWARALSPRMEFQAGPYVARFESETGGNETDTLGLRLGARYRWSAVTYLSLAVSGERNEITNSRTGQFGTKVNDWGLEASGSSSHAVGVLRYAVGRFIAPSTLGTRRVSDQLRLQYSHDLAPLTRFAGALRLSRDRRVGSNGTGERDRALVELTLIRQLTSTLAVSGGARYAWQDFGTEAARNTGVFLGLVYQGLDRREAAFR
ncbi:MAG: hypothetical protein O9284_00055 [Steroidobacteraceae bacterium]|jgi:hypothetical protein|nr:hypothetical protein [Steroidobacteraceae bacterium]